MAVRKISQGLKVLLHCEMFRATSVAMFKRHCGGVSRKLRPRKLRPQTSDPENSDPENSDPENSDPLQISYDEIQQTAKDKEQTKPLTN